MTQQLLPQHVKPRDLAEHLGVSERTLREKARALGACRIIGKEMIFLAEDVEAFMEGIKTCPLSSTNVGESGIAQAPLQGGDIASLRARLKKPTPKGSQRKPNTKHGSVVSMDRGRA